MTLRATLQVYYIVILYRHYSPTLLYANYWNENIDGYVLGKNVKGDSVICYRCGTKALRQLVYSYRKDIPLEDLPGTL